MPLRRNKVLGTRLLWLVGGRLGMLVFALLSTGLMTRDLGLHGFGDYRAAIGYLGMIVLLADLGLASIFVREISVPHADRDRVIGNAISVRLALACSAVAAAVALVFVLPFTPEARIAAVWAAPGFLAYSLHLMLFGLFQQQMKQSEVVRAEIVGAIVLLGAIVAIRDRQAPAAAFAAALSLSYLVTLAIALFFARRHASLVPRFDRPEWSRLMRAALPLALGTTMTIATFQSPTVLIAVLGAPEDVGNYGVPLKIFDSLMGIALLAIGLAAPLLASAAASDGERFAGTLRQGLSVLLIGGTALALVLVASAEIVVTVVGGAEFSGSATTLRLFALLFVVHSCALFLREAATAMRLQDHIARCIAPSMLLAFAGFAVLIPRFEGNGAVLALIASEALLIVNFLRLLLANAVAPTPLASVGRLAAAGLIAGGVVAACQANGIEWWMTTLISLPVYALFMLAFGSFAIRDVKNLALELRAHRARPAA